MSETGSQERLQSIFKQQMSFEKLFGHFSESALNVLLFADEEAMLLQHNYIGTEHVLMGLLREETSAAAQVLRDFGVELPAVRAVIEHIVGRGTIATTESQRPLTPRTLVVISLAVSEGWRSPQHAVNAEHLLLALIREGEGLAAAALENMGVNLEQLRTNVLMALFGSTPAETLRATIKNKSNVVTCRIDNQDLEALDALIEVGIRSTRSDAASWLIHAGVEANRDILESVYTTVAEMRQLRLKAQAIVQQLNKGDVKAAMHEKKTGLDEKLG